MTLRGILVQRSIFDRTKQANMAENLHLLRNKEERPFYYQPFKSAEIDLRKKKLSMWLAFGTFQPRTCVAIC